MESSDFENESFEASEKFLKRLADENNPLIFSYSSLRLLDPNNKAPIDFLRYFNTKVERLENKMLAFLHYLFGYAKHYEIIDDLRTATGKAQKKNAIEKGIPFIKRADAEAFPRMKKHISNIRDFWDTLSDADKSIRRLEMDIYTYKCPNNGLFYKIRRYRHLVNIAEQTVFIIKLGNFPNSSSKYKFDDLPLQAYIYSLGFESPNVYVVTVCENGYENIFKVSEETLQSGRWRLNKCLETFEYIKNEEAFYRSYDFFHMGQITLI